MVTITFELDERAGEALKELLLEGVFASPGEAASRALASYAERRREANAELDRLLEEGEASGIAEDFDFDTFLSRKNAEWADRA